MTEQRSPFQQNMHRLLRDMHIPDWDAQFLADYDPDRLAGRCADAGLDAVMIYAKSHVGLCTFPTKIGKMHAGLNGRDVLGELNDALRSRGIATSAYQSINFDNWAAETHPEWAQVDQSLGGPMHGHTRYGVCCPNNPEYRDYELGILEEILTGYEWDALWLDMTFFLAICSCDRCRTRFQEEAGLEIPTVVDWTDPQWATFQEARRRWIMEWITILIDRARQLRPEIAVTHNLASALSGWRCGQPLAAGRLDSYTSADLYGDRYEQLVVTKMAQHLSVSQPAELMVSLGKDLIDHVSLKSHEELAIQGLAATSVGSAFIVIDGIEPSGAELTGNFAAIKDLVEQLTPYEPYFGGTPVEDVAIYFSDHSFMNFADNNTDVPPPHQLGGDPFPHVDAVHGAARGLAEEHIAFGVVTSCDLERLTDYKVLLLPNVSRMSPEETAAIRQYVAAGGRLYASGYTSLVDTLGVRHDDFVLADVFGAGLAGEETGRVAYLDPLDAAVRDAIWPQTTLSHPFELRWGQRYEPKPLCSAPRLTATTGSPLAALTLPYQDGPDWGSVDRKSWASIHSAPPWTRTDHPVVVANSYGAGEVIFSAFAIEQSEIAANRRLFASLIQRLLGDTGRVSAQARNTVWLTVFDQQDRSRLLITLLNYASDQPPADESARVTVRAPSGHVFTGAEAGPGVRRCTASIVADEATVELDLTGGLGFLTVSYASSS